MMDHVIPVVKIIGAVAGALMPMFNIPLIMKIRARKSAKDISLAWAWGIWICIVLQTPAALMSSDIAFKSFGFTNIFLFSGVMFCVLKFHKQ
jgi:uncharacterized protein with PQ loop repeat